MTEHTHYLIAVAMCLVFTLLIFALCAYLVVYHGWSAWWFVAAWLVSSNVEREGEK